MNRAASRKQFPISYFYSYPAESGMAAVKGRKSLAYLQPGLSWRAEAG